MKPKIPVSLRNCSGRLCGSVATVPSTRSFRCVRSNVPAPVPSSGCARQDLHASCHQFQRLLDERFVKLFAPFPADVGVGSLNLCSTRDGVIPAANNEPTPTSAATITA